ncbi:hypothetical protein T440DRAFT_482697 [Plenodomus tracheiphilus IPT5]|uniref:Uncharacterized protein n=1 Tax=Plenodomus tracheiphilus IPT5 TaxID=1408161 RepID=A0A6A7AW48_9PLEO|nr:hypothetical protein T440DRAFT_482697 [Plenodomus tracheiphilus IPT5]
MPEGTGLRGSLGQRPALQAKPVPRRHGVAERRTKLRSLSCTTGREAATLKVGNEVSGSRRSGPDQLLTVYCRSININTESGMPEAWLEATLSDKQPRGMEAGHVFGGTAYSRGYHSRYSCGGGGGGGVIIAHRREHASTYIYQTSCSRPLEVVAQGPEGGSGACNLSAGRVDESAAPIAWVPAVCRSEQTAVAHCRTEQPPEPSTRKTAYARSADDAQLGTYERDASPPSKPPTKCCKRGGVAAVAVGVRHPTGVECTGLVRATSNTVAPLKSNP